jgi:hypothetical protein
MPLIVGCATLADDALPAKRSDVFRGNSRKLVRSEVCGSGDPVAKRPSPLDSRYREVVTARCGGRHLRLFPLRRDDDINPWATGHSEPLNLPGRTLNPAGACPWGFRLRLTSQHTAPGSALSTSNMPSPLSIVVASRQDRSKAGVLTFVEAIHLAVMRDESMPIQ